MKNSTTLHGGILEGSDGVVPVLSVEEYDKARQRLRIWEPCPSKQTVPPFPPYNGKSSIIAALPSVKGRDAEFAASLAAYFAKNGDLSPKQWAYARRIYDNHERAYKHNASLAMGHDWEPVGLSYWGNIHLGTYQNHTYKRCACCGAYGVTVDGNNYSGD